MSPPILAMPKLKGKYIIDTDRCDGKFGCVLLQEQPEGIDRPIGYWSRSLNRAENSYDTTHRESLAVIWVLLMLRLYVEGWRVTIRTGHDALLWILNIEDTTGNLSRWILRIQEPEFYVFL